MNPPADKSTQPENENTSPPDLHTENPLLRAIDKTVTELQTARSFIERDLQGARDDMKSVLERLTHVETKVDDLPKKTWIGAVVVGGMTFLAGLVAVLAKVFGH